MNSESVIEVDAPADVVWRVFAEGNTTVGIHEVTALGDGRTRVRQAIEQGGPIGAGIGWVLRGMTKRYLEMEGAGLTRLAEGAAKA